MYSLISCFATQETVFPLNQQAISRLNVPNLASSSNKTTTGKLCSIAGKAIEVDSSFSGSFFKLGLLFKASLG